MDVLIIGATGTIGSVVARRFASAGHRVSAMQRPGGRAVPAQYRPVAGNLTDPASLTAAAAGFDRVIHAGAALGNVSDLAAVEALLAGNTALIVTTGAAVLGTGPSDERSAPDPHPFAEGRVPIERRVLAAGGWVIRPGGVYDDGGPPGRGVLVRKAAERGMGVYIGEPGTRWAVVHVEDLADLYLAVAEHAAPGTVWHGVSETVRIDAIAAALGGGLTCSWPLAEAVAEIGPVAGLFAHDQDMASAITRRTLGWNPAHTAVIRQVVAATPPST
jgi:nucleoside-diphosphate-sugar epimerase